MSYIIDIVAGVRPQYVKMAYFIRAIEQFNGVSGDKISYRTINTGQHYDEILSGVFFKDFSLRFDFSIHQVELSPTDIIAQSFLQLTHYFTDNVRPNLVVVFGDANPSFIATVTASRFKLKILHVEAGEVRDNDEDEEVNRKVIDALSDVFFCVTEEAARYLTTTGHKNVFWTGDIAYDYYKEKVESVKVSGSTLGYSYILSSIHRPENLVEDVILSILDCLNECQQKVLMICHPRTSAIIKKIKNGVEFENIEFIEPRSHENLISLILNCSFVFTDSGGIIREASHLNKRCIVRRNKGAWDILIKAGFNFRVGTNKRNIKSGIHKLKESLGENMQCPELLFRKDNNDYLNNILIKLLSREI